MQAFPAMTGDSIMGFCKSTCTARILGGRCYVVVSLLVIFAASGGCAHKPTPRLDRGAVSGTVKYKGKPMTGGRVIFISAKDAVASASCMLQENGTYMVGDAPIGETRVTIDTESIKAHIPERYVQIPAKYLSAETSGLTYDVKPGDNTADFDLQ